MESPRFFADFNIVLYNPSIPRLNVIDLLIPLFEDLDFVFLTDEEGKVNDFFGGDLTDSNFFKEDVFSEGKFIVCDNVLNWYKHREHNKWIILVTYGISQDFLNILEEKSPTYYYLDLPTVNLEHLTHQNLVDNRYIYTYKNKMNLKSKHKKSNKPLEYLTSNYLSVKDVNKLENLATLLLHKEGYHVIYSKTIDHDMIREYLNERNVQNYEIMGDPEYLTDFHMLDFDIFDYAEIVRKFFILEKGKNITIHYYVSNMEISDYNLFDNKCCEIDKVYSDIKKKSHKIKFDKTELVIER